MNCKNCGYVIDDKKISTCPGCGAKIKRDKFPVWVIVLLVLFSLGFFTLPLVGIIAAMTIPALMTNTDKVRNRTVLKKTYSTFHQAFAINNAINGKDYITFDDVWTKTIKGNMNAVDIENGIKLADGTEVKYEKLRDTCTNVPEPEKIGESTACAKLTIDANGFGIGMDTLSQIKDGAYNIGDRFVLWMYSDNVEFAKDSVEYAVINNLDKN